MRASVTFDTLEFMDELKNSGMNQAHAEAITKAMAKAFNQMLESKELATKSDLFIATNQLEMRLSKYMVKCTVITVGLIGGLNTLFHFFPK
jgi:hypothetical protein